MSQFKGKQRADAGFTTSIKPLGNGRFGVRTLHNGVILFQDNKSRTKAEAAKALKAQLRMVDKCGWDSPMADASRHREMKKCMARTAKKSRS